MVDKLKVHYYEPFFSCNDYSYYDLMSTIHDYLLFYGVFTFKTTIEGALVNERTYSYALDYLRRQSKKSEFDSFLDYFNSHMKTDQINILRLVFNGKSDLLINYGGKNGIKKQLSDEEALLLDKVMIGKKTSGWVSDYIDQFFSELLPDQSEHTPQVMKKLFEDDSKAKSRITSEFQYNFPELFDLFSKVEDIIR